MFPPNYAKYRCALLCCNLICGNVNWHHIQIMGQIWHRHLLDNYFYRFQTIFFSHACQQMCTQTTLFTSLGMHMPMFLWFIFAHFPLCFLRVMVMTLLITKHHFPEQKAKKLGPTNVTNKHILLLQSLWWRGAHWETRKPFSLFCFRWKLNEWTEWTVSRLFL